MNRDTLGSKLRTVIAVVASLALAAGLLGLAEVGVGQRIELERRGPVAPGGVWEQDFRATRDPLLGYPPTERLLQIYRDLQSAPQAQTQGDPFLWEPRGPYSVGGRTRAVMFDPNDPTDKKVWAGGVNGGLWSIDDITSAVAEWTPVDDFWANLSITAMDHDPTDTQVFYVGTGEGWGLSSSGGTVGGGLWKSADGGATWAQLPATTDFAYVNDLVVRVEAGQDVLFVAVDATDHSGAPSNNNQGLYRSTDGGVSFTQVLPDVSGSPYAPADIELGADNRIHVGTLRNPSGNGGGVALYSDDGLSWTAQTLLAGGRRVELGAAPSSASHVYALVESTFQLGGAFRSTDGGVNWSAAPGVLPSNFANFQAWYDLILAVDPADPLVVYAGAVRLSRSLDGMGSWTTISSGAHVDYHALVYRPGSSSELLMGTDGGLYWSANADGASPVAAKRNDAYITTQFYAAAMHPDAGENFFIAGSQDNGTEKFIGPGIVETTGVTGGDGMFCFVNRLNPLIQISSQILNTYFRSLNGGNSFSPMPDVGGGLFRNPADYDPHQDVLYSSRDGSSIHRIMNIQGAVTANALPLAIGSGFGTYASALRVSPHTTSSTTLFIGTEAGRMFKVENAETNSPGLTEITSNMFPPGNVSSVEVGSSENELRISFSNYGVVSVWHTTDGGNQWVSKEGNLPDMPVRWLLTNPLNPDEVLLATQIGVWRTLDFQSVSPDWQPANAGLANVRVDMLRTRTSDNLVVAATHGRGLYSSTSFKAPEAGQVPNGDDLPGTQLTIARAAGNDITLSWGSSCTASDGDYEIYQGTLGTFTSHFSMRCSTGGATSETITPSPGNRYYLVVPRNAVVEGSYGTDSDGLERPKSLFACRDQLIGGCN